MPGGRMVSVIALSGLLLGCETSGPANCNGQPSSDEVCIMGGSFFMGHAPIPGSIAGESPFAPVQRVTLSPFFIDIDPVSNAQYKACFDAGACPDESPCGDPCVIPFQAAYSLHNPAQADYPMATATIDGAEAYCLFAGKRLPTEAEWERAARGPQSFDYSWGNTPPDCAALHCDLPSFDPNFPHSPGSYPVGLATADVSPEGVRGMLTTVHHIMADGPRAYSTEPVTNPRGPVQEERAARGNLHFYGSILETYNGVSYPLPAGERKTYYVGGLRCARSGM
jgi:formylglycine-generating enzyme required for sulfatase activity